MKLLIVDDDRIVVEQLAATTGMNGEAVKFFDLSTAEDESTLKELTSLLEKLKPASPPSTGPSEGCPEISGIKQTTYKKRFLVKVGKHIYFKNTKDIALFRADDQVCYMVEAKTGRQYLVDHTLEELDQRLLNPIQFFRINRKYIVNIDAISDIRLHNAHCEIYLNFPFKEELKVSRNRVKSFKSWIDA